MSTPRFWTVAGILPRAHPLPGGYGAQVIIAAALAAIRGTGGDFRRKDAGAGNGVDLLAGYFAPRSPMQLTVTPITGTAAFRPLLFQYDIAVGVRKGDNALKAQIDGVLVRHQSEIAQLLERYGVPLAKDDQARTNPN